MTYQDMPEEDIRSGKYYDAWHWLWCKEQEQKEKNERERNQIDGKPNLTGASGGGNC